MLVDFSQSRARGRKKKRKPNKPDREGIGKGTSSQAAEKLIAYRCFERARLGAAP
jgi:hypothetical protein